MAMNNRDRIGRAFDLLSEGLHDVVDEAMTRKYGSGDWNERWAAEDASRRGGPVRSITKQDVQTQLRAITEQGYHFKEVLSRPQQSFASELRESRNRWAHNDQFSSDDTARALDTMERLLRAVDSQDSAEEIRRLRLDLQRTVYEEQTRKQAKRKHVALVPGEGGLPPWREVIHPHEDVRSGGYNASEFAADLHLVHTGRATSPEYGDPVRFFQRTYLTEGLRDLLSRALRRLNGDGGASPVVNLQTNFGGGKTHSMLALYHLFSGTPAQALPQELQELIAETGADPAALRARRVALVGTYLKPGSPSIKADGTEVRTMWGELAWQLGGREAYDIVAADDRAGTNPGEALRLLLQRHSPALILVDEWVAYARQLLSERELPAGSFETQFTFAQSLTEVVRSVPGTMLVVSVPASDAGTAQAGSDIEIGGEHGRLALDRLQNVIRRVADQWRPSSKDESFEIVRRRLFQTPDADGFAKISTVARSFVTMYRNASSQFPREAATPDDDYEQRIRASYPLHPELLDRLYEDWSSLERFQRTRGVLKLVSSIVHELWAENDSSPLILPGTVPLDAQDVNTDLTQYLEDQWKPIIDADIDGPSAIARRIDLDRPALGERFTTQRIARTIFMGAAPRTHSSRKGLDKQYLWLGTAIPGDKLGNFGSAVELLAQRSTYFYEDQGHYWFDTRPSIAKTANDYAERLREDEETVWNEIVRRIQLESRNRGPFERVHVAPESTADIPDLEELRLVVAHPRHSWSKQRDVAGDAAHAWVQDALEHRGSAQRIHRNTLVFLLADRSGLEGLAAATRSYLGWEHVHANSEQLDLSVQQRKQAQLRTAQFDQTVADRLRDAFVWAVYPQQLDSTKPFQIQAVKISGSSSLAERTGAKLKHEEEIVEVLAPDILGGILHRDLGEWWRQHREIRVGELWGYFTRHPYLPRLLNRGVLDEAIEQAKTAVLPTGEDFALAADKDPESGRYRGLLLLPDPRARVQITDATLLLDVEHAQQQIEQDRAASGTSTPDAEDSPPASLGPVDHSWPERTPAPARSGAPAPEQKTRPTRFFGSIQVDPELYARDIDQLSREIFARLAGSGARLQITIDIQALKPQGFTDAETRTIKENAASLKFAPGFGFEQD